MLGKAIPSKKNHHFPGKGGHVLIDKPIKERMAQLEDGILSALYLWCQTRESGTDLAWQKHARMLLSGLSDDSLREIPQSSFGVEYVPKGSEGVIITIELLL